MIIAPEEPRHAAAIEDLLELSFGPQRFAKTVYRLRDGVPALPDLCFVALNRAGGVEGTLRFWPITIGGATPALLLGPIAVTPPRRSQGLGDTLMRHGLARAAAAGHHIVLLVGDAPYYGRFGFTRRATLALALPGPVDPARFLGLELAPGALSGVVGPASALPTHQLPATPEQRQAGGAAGAAA
jgi:predicted N-acetyltransferase YhbS